MSEKALVFSAKDGLGNRLRALVGFRALADLRDVPLLLHWPRDGACAAEFTALFETGGWDDVRLIDADEAAERKARWPECFHYSSVWFTEVWREHGQSLCSLEGFSRAAIRHLRALQPREELRARVDEFAEVNGLAQCVGMHIRMTDNVHAYDWWTRNDPDFAPTKVSRLEGFQALVEECAARGERVFVCSDNEDIVRRLEATYRNVVVVPKSFDRRGFAQHVRTHYGEATPLEKLIGRLKSRLGFSGPTSWRTTQVADALVDMLLLGRCKGLVGTYYSSFSQVAALFGNVSLLRMEGGSAVEDALIRELLGYAADLQPARDPWTGGPSSVHPAN